MIRRHCKAPKDADEQTLRSVAKKTIQDEGYDPKSPTSASAVESTRPPTAKVGLAHRAISDRGVIPSVARNLGYT
ncbi:MAG TPA: hypothetical protein VGR55_15995 [Candidatus Acidoferrum sp.]|nr:hypothetical protein [Candidatus Acidoferrum sp.]